jgi:hypothetical protein
MNDPEKKPEDTTVTASTVVSGGIPSGPVTVGQPVVGAATPAVKAEDLPKGTPGRPLKLKYPIKSGDKTLSEVAFSRRPKARDLVQTFGTTALEQELYTIAALTGVIPEDLLEMDGADYLAVQREYAAFLGL